MGGLIFRPDWIFNAFEALDAAPVIESLNHGSCGVVQMPGEVFPRRHSQPQ
jgi:hypothetical protein